MKIRRLTSVGEVAYVAWLQTRKLGEMPPSRFLDGTLETENGLDIEIDLERNFTSRQEFGKYLFLLFAETDVRSLLSTKHDGVWNWLTIAYFNQFGKKISKFWHYAVTRSGHSGSLAYRHLARTSFEMYWRHGEDSFVLLSSDMATWGDLSEQLTSRQNVAYHKGIIKTANSIYVSNGKIRRGAAARVPPKAKRKVHDQRGKGGVARLALAVRRLNRTFDTHMLATDAMINILPKEFSAFVRAKGAPAAEAIL